MPKYMMNVVSKQMVSSLDIMDPVSNVRAVLTQIYCKVITGKTKIEFENGNTYEGEAENGMLEGQGVYRFEDGTVYSGSFQRNLFNGSGRLDSPDGSYYMGQFCNGKRHGQGILYQPKLNFVYDGDFEEGKMNGKAVIKYKNE